MKMATRIVLIVLSLLILLMAGAKGQSTAFPIPTPYYGVFSETNAAEGAVIEARWSRIATGVSSYDWTALDAAVTSALSGTVTLADGTTGARPVLIKIAFYDVEPPATIASRFDWTNRGFALWDDTPQWVYDSALYSSSLFSDHKTGYAPASGQALAMVPRYDDDAWRRSLQRFVVQLGERYQGRSGVVGFIIGPGYNGSSSWTTANAGVTLTALLSCNDYTDYVSQWLQWWRFAVPQLPLYFPTGALCPGSTNALSSSSSSYSFLEQTFANLGIRTISEPSSSAQDAFVINQSGSQESYWSLLQALSWSPDLVITNRVWDTVGITQTIQASFSNNTAWVVFRGPESATDDTYPFFKNASAAVTPAPAQLCNPLARATVVAAGSDCAGYLPDNAGPTPVYNRQALEYAENNVIPIDVVGEFSYNHTLSTTAPYTISLTYFNQGTDTVAVDYATATSVKSLTITKTNSTTWLTQSWLVTGVSFDNRLHGVDFEIHTLSGSDILHKFSVTAATPRFSPTPVPNPLATETGTPVSSLYYRHSYQNADSASIARFRPGGVDPTSDGYVAWGNLAEQEIQLIKFPLLETTGVSVTRVSLLLYVASKVSDQGALPVTVYTTTVAWDASTVTWNTARSHVAATSVTFTTDPAFSGYTQVVDVTSIWRSLKDGIALVPTNNCPSSDRTCTVTRLLAGASWPIESERPALVVEGVWTITKPTATPTATPAIYVVNTATPVPATAIPTVAPTATPSAIPTATPGATPTASGSLMLYGSEQSQDTYISNTDSSSHAGESHMNLVLGQTRGLIQFWPALLPKRAHVNSASLTLVVDLEASRTMTVEVANVTRTFDDSATWTQAVAGYTSWNTAGMGAADIGVLTTTLVITRSGPVVVDITTIAQSIADGTSTGIALIPLSASSALAFPIRTSEYGSDGLDGVMMAASYAGEFPTATPTAAPTATATPTYEATFVATASFDTSIGQGTETPQPNATALFLREGSTDKALANFGDAPTGTIVDANLVFTVITGTFPYTLSVANFSTVWTENATWSSPWATPGASYGSDYTTDGFVVVTGAGAYTVHLNSLTTNYQDSALGLMMATPVATSAPVATATAQATAVMTPDIDTYVADSSPTTAHGTELVLQVEYGDTWNPMGVTMHKQSLLHFNLGALAGGQIKKAELSLYVEDGVFPASLRLGMIDASWTTTATWNAPWDASGMTEGVDWEWVGAKPAPTVIEHAGSVTLDVTDIILEQISRSNYDGIVIRN